MHQIQYTLKKVNTGLIQRSNAIGKIKKNIQEAKKVKEASIEDAKPDTDRAGSPEEKRESEES